MTKKIQEHQGKKYLRWIHSADEQPDAHIDVYSVLEAFQVTCPARQHAIKKLLCCGNRGKGTELEDLLGVEAAVARAIELQRAREAPIEGEIGKKQKEVNDRVQEQLLKTVYDGKMNG